MSAGTVEIIAWLALGLSLWNQIHLRSVIRVIRAEFLRQRLAREVEKHG